MGIASLLRIILSITTLALASCTPQPPAVAEVTPTPRPVIEVTSFPSTFQIDDIDIEFSGSKVEKDNFIIMICFRPPTQEVWSFSDTKLTMQHIIFKESWTSAKGGIGIAGRSNCGELAYPINLIPSPGKAELSIGQLVTSFYGNCERAQKNLDQAKTGIGIRCDPNIKNGLGFVIVKKPIFMKDEEAIFKAYNAFSDTIQVNWRFSFFVNKR
jgi:hypothetical protein